MHKLFPGAHDGVPNEVYHGDCCDGPSISSTGIRVCARDPFLYWQTSPFNPIYVAAQEQEKRDREEAGAPPPPASRFTRFSKGSAAHLMLLEPELVSEGIAVVPREILASNGALSTKAAKAFVAEQADAGRVVVTPDQWDQLNGMVDALAADPMVRNLLKDVTVEQSHIWQDPETGIYLKSRPDVMSANADDYIVDFKTTDREDIAAWERAAVCDHRLDMQAALQTAGAHETRGFRPKGVIYIVQHIKTARIAVRFFDRDTHREMFNVARADLRRGINAFAACWESGSWNGPWELAQPITVPDFRARQIERETTAVAPGEYSI